MTPEERDAAIAKEICDFVEPIERETIEESVYNLKDAKFSWWFSRYMFPGWGYSPRHNSISLLPSLEDDPRIARLLLVGRNYPHDSRIKLLSYIEREIDLFGSGSEYRIQEGQFPSIGFSPSLVLPLIVAVADRGGETLPILVDLARAYIDTDCFLERHEILSTAPPELVPHYRTSIKCPDSEFGDSIPTNQQTCVLANAFDIVLHHLEVRIAKEQRADAAPPSLRDYADLRSALCSEARSSKPENGFKKELSSFDPKNSRSNLERAWKRRLFYANLLEKFGGSNSSEGYRIMSITDSGLLRFMNESCESRIPDWYHRSAPGSGWSYPDWLLIGMGLRVNDDLNTQN
ncbi:MAG: hypothetical protein GC168_09305 [Candidatus Hydrogenedens sp.]|nr:hypothetical protein [Candidatus Hydrogenedens sp.]